MSSKTSIPRGTRDFSSEEVRKREYIFDTIKKVFRLYGFEPIETPAMENLSTLLGKYGDEGDKLLFKILNSGDSLDDFQMTDENIFEGKWISLVAATGNFE
jgi:histidyl-tRNA synthetase